MTQSRWKSKVLWTTLIALIVLVGGNYGLWDAIGMTSETFQAAADLILAAAITLGLINNPSDAEKY
jgi:uncharacterized membrane protein